MFIKNILKTSTECYKARNKGILNSSHVNIIKTHSFLAVKPRKAILIISTSIITPILHGRIRGDLYDP